MPDFLFPGKSCAIFRRWWRGKWLRRWPLVSRLHLSEEGEEKKKKTAAYFLISHLCWKRKLACFCSGGGAAATQCQCTEMVFISWIPTVEVSQQRATGIPPDKWFDIVLHLPAHFPQDYLPHMSLNSSQVVPRQSLFLIHSLYQTLSEVLTLACLVNIGATSSGWGSQEPFIPWSPADRSCWGAQQQPWQSAGPQCVYERHDRHS